MIAAGNNKTFIVIPIFFFLSIYITVKCIRVLIGERESVCENVGGREFRIGGIGQAIPNYKWLRQDQKISLEDRCVPSL